MDTLLIEELLRSRDIVNGIPFFTRTTKFFMVLGMAFCWSAKFWRSLIEFMAGNGVIAIKINP